MLETLNTYFTMYGKTLSANPALAGMSIYIVGILTYMLRKIPTRIYNFVIDSTTTSLRLVSAGTGGYNNEVHYNAFLEWFMRSSWSKWSRSLSTGRGWNGKDEIGTITGPGIGWHCFVFQHQFFWFDLTEQASSGSDKNKYEVHIRTFGRSHKSLLALIKDFEFQQKEDDELGIYVYTSTDGWGKQTRIKRRSLNTVFIKPGIKADILKGMSQLTDNPEWFHAKGIDHKATFLFYGPPGTGKTALAKSIASEYSRNIYLLDLSMMTNSSLSAAMATVPKKSLVLIEDVDAATAAVNSRDVSDSAKPMISSIMDGMLTLSGLLNVLDGVVPLNDVVVCMSTNKPEKLDPALTRKSRVDFAFEIGFMETPEIEGFIAHMYSDQEYVPGLNFLPVSGSDVQAAFRNNPYDLEAFLAELPVAKPCSLAA